eukprot:1176577-Prorocentrum_minimum.AAC.3
MLWGCGWRQVDYVERLQSLWPGPAENAGSATINGRAEQGASGSPGKNTIGSAQSTSPRLHRTSAFTLKASKQHNTATAAGLDMQVCASLHESSSDLL